MEGYLDRHGGCKAYLRRPARDHEPRGLGTERIITMKTFKSPFIVAAVLLAMGAVALPASARGVPAYPGGRSAFPADASCFSEQWGAAVNNCSTTRSYTISLPVDAPGWKHVWVAAYGPTATSNVSC